MEYWEGGDISQLIKKCISEKEHIPEDHIWKILTQISVALHEWHNRKTGKILHRDIKPGNLFLDASNNVKLGDFGLSRIMGKESIFAYTNVGTPYYMSPEQINEQKYNEKSDIWSTGCIIYEIAALKPPFEAKTQVSLALKIKDGKYNRLPKIYSEELWRVIKLMLNPDKKKRPAVEDLLNIPQVSLRLREKRLKDHISKLKKREEEMKNKEIKFIELEAELLKQKDEIKEKNKKLEEKEKILQIREQELEELREKLRKKESTPPLITSDTPKPLGERGSCFRDQNKSNYSSSSVYHSLKQEIQELSQKVSYDPDFQTKLKKQTSWIASYKDEICQDKSSEREKRKGCLGNKSNIGYKSCERRNRTYEDIVNNKKSYDYKRTSHTKLSGGDNKENVTNWADYRNPSSQILNAKKDYYATPPFKSNKSKIPDGEKGRVHTTSCRLRSGIYKESSGNMRQRGSKERLRGENTNKSYAHEKDNYRNHFVLRRGLSNNLV